MSCFPHHFHLWAVETNDSIPLGNSPLPFCFWLEQSLKEGTVSISQVGLPRGAGAAPGPCSLVKICCFFQGSFLLLGMKDTRLELYQTASAEPWKFKTSSISLTKWNLWLLCACCLLKTNPTPVEYSEGAQSLNFDLLWNISFLCVWLEAVIWLSSIWFRVQRLWRAKTLQSQSTAAAMGPR